MTDTIAYQTYLIQALCTYSDAYKSGFQVLAEVDGPHHGPGDEDTGLLECRWT